MLLVHEYTHRLQFDYVSGIHKTLHPFLGSLVSPNKFVPDFLTEGLAIYQESQIMPFQGRLNDGFYHSLIKLKAANKTILPISAAGYQYLSFPYGHWYFYGALFTEHLYKKIGSPQVSDILNQQSSNT